LVPSPVKDEVRQRIREASSVDANRILAALYMPDRKKFEPAQRKSVWHRPARQSSGHVALPIPPPELMMGYSKDGQEFLSMGKRTSDSIRRILEQHGEPIGRGPVLEWGCASGRVLRHFASEAAHVNFWGIDIAGSHIDWAKANLSPPFKFMSCTAYPHLPFEDNSFRCVYGVSVFTHMIHLIDMWLMEFRRILAPGGHALFTIHDEHTWQWFAQHPDEAPVWAPGEDFSKALDGDLVVFQSAQDASWFETFTCFRTDWVAEEWGRYLEVVAIEPLAEDYQTAVVLRKG
jgi:SAM-dependent methyltransferase